MGAFQIEVAVGRLGGDQFEAVEALVDTGSTYTWMPASLLRRAGVVPVEQREFILADGRSVFYSLAWASIRLDGRTQPTPVVFGEEGTDALLGVVTLEEFGLGVDPVNRRLIPTPALLK